MIEFVMLFIFFIIVDLWLYPSPKISRKYKPTHKHTYKKTSNNQQPLEDGSNPFEITTSRGTFMSREAKQKYLQSKEWRLLKATRLAMDSYQCKMCGTANNLECHHISYDRLGNENLSTDVITLCRDCHQKIHDRLGYNRTTKYPIEEV